MTPVSKAAVLLAKSRWFAIVLRTTLLFMAVTAVPQRVYAQCQFDYWGARTSQIGQTAGNAATIVATTNLTHATAHSMCSGNVKAQAELVGPSTAPPCSTTSSGSHTYAQARKSCTSLPGGEYWTHGKHYWENTLSSESDSQAVNLSGDEDPCEGGCEPGYTQNCVGDQEPDECGCCVDYSPIVISLAGALPRFSDAAGGVPFAINDSGSILRVAWLLDNKSGWLALDRNNDGAINDGSELFGNTTRLNNGQPARHGYEALGEFDQNGDKVINSQDSVFASLRLWVDADRDGISQPSELVTLAAAGVIGISLEAKESKQTDGSGNRYRFRAAVFASSAPFHRMSYDVFPVTTKLDGANVCPTKPGLRVPTAPR